MPVLAIAPWMVVPRVIGVAAVLFVLLFIFVYIRSERLRPNSLEWIDRRQEKSRFTLSRAGRLVRRDALPMLVITAVYAVSTFVRLGDTVAPQSFFRIERGDTPAVIELKEPAYIERVFYYTGIGNGYDGKAYYLQFSSDGRYYETQTAMTQNWSQVFRWMKAELLKERPEDTRFIRLSAMYPPLELGEVSIVVRGEAYTVPDPDNPGETIVKYHERILTADDLIIPEEAAALFDEQELVPARYDVMNSSHFDEIYHARAAYEHLRGIYTNEITHPPLGKLITSTGIALFGMTPFGWRFMPALFGVFMVPPIYILLKWMFGKTPVAVCGTLLFAFDFMHFVQTRISTIDVYAVFFILFMYLFMYRYITSGYDAPFWETAPWLILTGLSFGIGAAAKWVCIYAGAGLFLLYVIYLACRARHYRTLGRSFMPYLLATLLLSLLTFIIIPGIVYIACYIPYAKTHDPAFAASLTGSFSENTVALIKETWNEFYENQLYMFSYHSDRVLDATHDYAARWYDWLIDLKPILYYWNSVDAEGTRASLWAFTNPVVTWAGLGALAACAVGIIRRKSHTALFIIIGFLSQLIPWIPIKRITFPYHYFPSMIFICLGIAYMFHRMIERDKERGTRYMIIFTAVAVGLFIMFYPSLSGLQVPSWYPDYLLRWIPNKHWLM